MIDPATYRKYADECRRLATTAPENDRRLLLEHADVWLKLAEEAERDAYQNLVINEHKKGRRFPPLVSSHLVRPQPVANRNRFENYTCGRRLLEGCR